MNTDPLSMQTYCACPWLNVSGINGAPESSWVRGTADPACLAHRVDTRPPRPIRPGSKPFVEYGPSSGPTLAPKGVPGPSAWAPVWYAVSGSLFVLFAVSVVDGHGWRAVTMLTAMLGASWLARSLTR